MRKSTMTKAELVAHLKEMFAAEDYFTGVLGNRHNVVLSKPSRRKKTAVKRVAKDSAKAKK